MALLRLEIRNYRCFTADSPLVIPMDKAVVAFVGPNNAGKSTALRSIYELKNILSLSSVEGLVSVLQRPQPESTTFHGTSDPSEVFPDGVKEPLTVDWIFASEPGTDPGLQIGRIRLNVERETRALSASVALANGDAVSRSDGLRNQDPSHFVLHGHPILAFGLEAAVQQLRTAKLVPSTRAMVATPITEIFESFQGGRLASDWLTWKTGSVRARHTDCDDIERLMARTFGFEELQINVSPPSTFSIKIGRHTRRLDELGHGFSQMLYFAIDAVARPASVLLVDEPEAGMHPALQRDLLAFLLRPGVERMLFATHSLGLARSFADEIFVVRRRKSRTEVSSLTAVRNFAEFLGELSFSAWSDVGFEAVLLVEGPLEIRAFPALLRLLKLDTRVMLMSLGGSNFINGHEDAGLAEFKRLNVPVFGLIDSERNAADAPLSPQREAFLRIVGELGYEVHVLERRATENYVTARALANVTKPGEKRPLEPFERIQGDSAGWVKGDLPGLFAGMPWEDLEKTDLGRFLKHIEATLAATRRGKSS